MDTTKTLKVEDTSGDKTRVSADPARNRVDVNADTLTMYFTPKQARKLARHLRRAADAVEQGNSATA